MKARSRALAVAAAALIVVGSVSPAWASTALVLSQRVGPPTSLVKAGGSGFGKNERVNITFDGRGVAHGTTNGAGSFSGIRFQVPASARPGTHEVRATGRRTGRTAHRNFLVRTDWAQFHFASHHRGSNPFENVIGPSNVGTLRRAWFAPTGGAVSSSPAVAGGVVYVGSDDHKLYAFNARGAVHCSGTPKTCSPLWTAATSDYVRSTPAVAGGVVYVGSVDHKLYAFDAHGVTNCSGTPKTCNPLWTATTGGAIYSSPAVAGEMVYVGSSDGKLYAFDAHGVTNCSGTPKTCTPLWTGAAGDQVESPAVAGGVVYVGSQDNTLYAFDADASTTNCSGTTTKTCTPLWTGATGDAITSSPAVAGGMVYVGSFDNKLYAFDADASVNCSGTTTKACTPLWTGATGDAVTSSPAVAGGVVYVGSRDYKLYAFDADASTNCSGTPTKTCTPLWTGATGSYVLSSPAVARGVVYVGSHDYKLYAFDARGAINCSGTPTTCTPLRTRTTGAEVRASPAVANGIVYVGSDDKNLYAFSLP